MKLLSLVNRLPEWLSSYALREGPGRKCESWAQRGSSSSDMVAILMALRRSPSWYSPSLHSHCSSLRAAQPLVWCLKPCWRAARTARGLSLGSYVQFRRAFGCKQPSRCLMDMLHILPVLAPLGLCSRLTVNGIEFSR